MTDPDDFIDQAGAPTEESTDRNGFFSYHAEPHAVAVGAGLAFLAVVQSQPGLLGLVVPAITSGLRGKNGEFSKIIRDCYQEPHYALGGIVLGAVLGVPVRLVLGLTALPTLPL